MFNAATNKEPIMNATNKVFYNGVNRYKTVSAAAAALITGMMLVWFYAAINKAERNAEIAYAAEHRITVTATKLVEAPSAGQVANLGSASRFN